MGFKKTLIKFWRFLWYEDSILSWIVNIILAFVLIKFLLYPGLSFVFQTSLPIVAVVSGSMEHHPAPMCDQRNIAGICVSYSKETFGMCGTTVDKNATFWDICGTWYENRNISQETFKTFSFKNGFNTGDIMIVYGKSYEKVEVGDVIVYRNPGFFGGRDIIHRVVQRNETTLLTKGDHNSESDPVFTTQAEYQGVAIARIPYLGYVKIWAVKALGFVTGKTYV